MPKRVTYLVFCADLLGVPSGDYSQPQPTFDCLPPRQHLETNSDSSMALYASKLTYEYASN